MDWDKLRIFHAAAAAGSFTHAGEALHLSQSAISRQVAALEYDLKTPLFHRHARGLLLTEQGEMLFRTVQEVLVRAGERAAAPVGCARKAAWPVEGHRQYRLRLGLAGAASGRIPRALSRYRTGRDPDRRGTRSFHARGRCRLRLREPTQARSHSPPAVRACIIRPMPHAAISGASGGRNRSGDLDAHRIVSFGVTGAGYLKTISTCC